MDPAGDAETHAHLVNFDFQLQWLAWESPCRSQLANNIIIGDENPDRNTANKALDDTVVRLWMLVKKPLAKMPRTRIRCSLS